MNCPLCKSLSQNFFKNKLRSYQRCNNCHSIFLESKYYLSQTDEKKRYLEHNNDVTNIGYQNFVKPVVDKVKELKSSSQIGLDFGAGPGPILSYLLKETGYNVETYDPFFFPNHSLLEKKYDYIMASEVAEHFFNPFEEFTKLKQMLKEEGILFIYTDLYFEGLDFSSWYYKNDPTHVFFYSKDTFHWIQKTIGFRSLKLEGRLVILEL